VPIHIAVDETRKLRTVTMWGSVDDKELVETFSQCWSAPDFDPSMREFHDLSKLEGSEVTTAGLRELARIDLALNTQGATLGRAAVYAPSDLRFGISRMYQAFVDASDGSIEVFRDRRAALEWLGLLPDLEEG